MKGRPAIFEFVDLPAAITSINVPAQLKGYVTPPKSLTSLVVQVAGTIILNEIHPAGTVFEENFTADWTPTHEGTYLLTPEATDVLSGTATITTTLLVDVVSRPTATLDKDFFAGEAYSSGTGIFFSGSASDPTGIITATAQLDFGGKLYPLAIHLGGSAIPAGYFDGQAVYTQTTWSSTWWELTSPPDHASANLDLTLVDASQNPTTITFPVFFDFVPPVIGDVTILANGLPISVGRTYTETTLNTLVTIPPVTEGSSDTILWYGWTETDTATVDQLTRVNNPWIVNSTDTTFSLSVADGGKVRWPQDRVAALHQFGAGQTREIPQRGEIPPH